MGNQGLYRRMLRRTLEDNPADELYRHIGEGDHEAAVRDMHTLKGNAAMLGLLDVSAQAQTMEATLKQGEEQAAMDMLPALLTRLQTARSSIEQYLEGTAEV
jgi:HPt (histidine-containing phosphotransfer) domain-containing protein